MIWGDMNTVRRRKFLIGGYYFGLGRIFFLGIFRTETPWYCASADMQPTVDTCNRLKNFPRCSYPFMYVHD